MAHSTMALQGTAVAQLTALFIMCGYDAPMPAIAVPHQRSSAMSHRHQSFAAGHRHHHHHHHHHHHPHHHQDAHAPRDAGPHPLTPPAHADQHADGPSHVDASHLTAIDSHGAGGGAPNHYPGFDAGDLDQLFGHVPQLAGGIVVMPVDHLTINNNQFIENHLTENNSIVFNAAPGGTVDVGGDVSALSAQHLDVQGLSTSHASGSELGWGDAAWGEAGGFEAVLFGHMPGLGGAGPGPLVIMPVDHLTINNNSFVQNFETENTNIVFNAAAGGTVDVGGDVNALSSQTGEIGHQPHDALFA
jgi:hypothetical protein